jgi:hypothetical protein
MDSKTIRINTVRQALTSNQSDASLATAQQLELLTQYVLGQLSLTQTNERLRQHGRTLILVTNQRELVA